MTKRLRVLIVEDTPDEAELMVLRLKDAGLALDWTRVEDEAKYIAGLESQPDLILADWRLPRFSGLRALEVMRARGLDIPFVIVSGSIGEEAAIDAMRLGAYDYVLKDRPARLAPAVRHALDDKILREERSQAEAALRASETRYRSLFEGIPVGVYRTAEDGRLLVANAALASLLGYASPEEMIGLEVSEIYIRPEDQAQWRKAVEKAGVLHDAEIQLRRTDGSRIWARDSGRAVYDESGRLLYFEGTLSDITARKRAEKALRESEERYRKLLEIAPVGIAVHRNGFVVFANPAGVRILGGTDPDQIIGRPISQIIHPEGLQKASDRIRRMMAGEQGLYPTEDVYVRFDGSPVDVEVQAAPAIHEGEGAIQVIVQDITERKQAEAHLRASEERYRDLVENIHELICTHDLDGHILSVNRSAVELTGYSVEELLGRKLQDLLLPENRHLFGAYLAGLRETGAATGLLTVLTKAGERRIWEYHNTLRTEGVSRPIVRGYAKDVTERKRAEHDLIESERRYRALFENMTAGFVLFEIVQDERGVPVDLVILAANEGFEVTTGLKKQDVIGKRLTQVLSGIEDDAADWIGTYAKVALTGESSQFEAASELLGVHYSATAYKSGEKQCAVTFVDVTERVRAEKARRESEAHLRALFAAMTDVVIVYDAEGRYISIAPTNPLNLYRPSEEMLGKTVHEILPRETADYTVGMIREAIQTDRVVTGVYTLRFRGEEVWFAASASRLSESTVVWVAHDITALKRVELALRRRAAELEGLYLTSMETLARGDLDGLLLTIVERAAELTGGDRGGLYLATADGERIRLFISYNMGRDYTGLELALGEGVSGRVARDRRALMVEDYNAWGGKTPQFAETGIGRVLAVPMLVGDRLVGVLNVADLNTGSYGEEDIRLVQLFADQAAMAIESARLVDETTRRASYLEALTATAEALRAATTPEEMYSTVLEQVVRQLRAEGASLSMLDRAEGEVVAVLAVGAWEATTGMRLRAGQGIVGLVTAGGEPIVSADVRGDARLARPELLEDLPAVACVPLTVENETIGCVMIGRHTPFTSEEIRLFTGLAEIAGNAIHRARVMATLEDRVRQRTRDLEEANDRLLELDRMKTEFVSNVTHELRTPITNVLLYVDLARRTDSEAKRTHYFEVLKSESMRLGKLIEEVLTLSRLERGVAPMELEVHPLDALLADVLVAHQARAEAKRISLDHDPNDRLPVVSLNRVQMHQVLTNLVANAVAYSPPGGRVHLGTAQTDVEGRGYVGAVIHNTGAVIGPHDMEHLFERFYRGAIGRESGEPGTGLGLAISKEIVELHHGWIDVESSEQGGTTFTVWLPQSSAA